MDDSINYALLLQQSPDLYLILSPNLIILDATDAYLKATMRKKEDVVGSYLFDAFPNNPQDEHATGVDNLSKSLQYVLSHKRAHIMPIQKYDLRRPQSAEFVERYWKPYNVPVLNKNNKIQYIIHRVEDVTELHQLQKKEQEKSQRLDLLIEHIKDYAIIMLDPEGNVVTWNTGAEMTTGYSKHEVLGQHFSIFYPEDLIRENHPEIELYHASHEGRYAEEGWRKHKDGSIYWASIFITPIYDVEKELIGYSKVVHDLSKQKEIENLKNDFISMVNHELRTPLTSIIGVVKLLQKEAIYSSGKLQELLRIANANCERLLRLINDILDIEKLEAQRMRFDVRKYSLNKIMKEVIALNNLFFKDHFIEIVYKELDDNILILTDKDRLIQVFTNLFSNAVKFSFPNKAIHIITKKNNGRIRISICNEGPGIPLKFKENIFKKFSQAALGREMQGGTGLGLAISKAILEHFGIDLKYKSTKNKETEFYFDVPYIYEDK